MPLNTYTMPISPPPIRITLQYDEAATFMHYLHNCNVNAFIPTLGYTMFEPYRETLLEFNTQVLIDKVTEMLIRRYFRRNLNCKLVLTYGERVTLSVLFKRINVPPDIIHLQTIVLDKLTLKSIT